MLRIYQRLWQVTWAEQWQYRANLLMYLLYWIVSPVVFLAVWTSVANSQGNVGGLTANDFVTYYLALLITEQITSEITIHTLGFKIQDGTLASDLLRPVHPVLTYALINNLAFKALSFIVLIPVWLALTALFRPDFSTVTFGSLALAGLASLLGFAISFLFGAIVTSLGFWTTRVIAIYEFYYAVGMLFSGQFVPLDLMPQVIRQVAQFLPFQIFRYVPIQIALNRLSPEEILRDFGVSLVWLVLVLALFQWVWRAGSRRFSSVGG